MELEAELTDPETKENVISNRYYHPLSKINDQGYFDLLVRVYLRDFKFPKGGLFT